MKGKIFKRLMWVLLLSSAQAAIAQKRNSLTITDDAMVLTINLKSSKAQLDSILTVAGLSGIRPARLINGDFNNFDEQGWKLELRHDDVVTFKRLLNALNYNPQDRPYKVTAQIPSIEGKPGYPADVKFGVNKYAKITVYELASGVTRFILPGYNDARRVFLSGSFNDWSTLKGLMKKTDGGWLLDIKLEPGAYEYKYIVDGQWTTDPNNLVRVHDGAGNTNSVYFKYNHTFKLGGFPVAQRITVAGDFNDWDANTLIMQKRGSAWELPMYLAEGKYLYRFMVDGKWTADPVNLVTPRQKDTSRVGDKYVRLDRVLYIGEMIQFRPVEFRNAKSVVLEGDFPGFDRQDLTLQKTAGDAWQLMLVLPAGNYDYRYIVDGKPAVDPLNPHRSVRDNAEWSFLAVKPNYTFTLSGHGDAKVVTLCGVFNNWQPDGYTMRHKDNAWTIAFHLKPGKYLYKFRVDGDWIIDPGNRLWEQNEPRTGNSVLWIE